MGIPFLFQSPDFICLPAGQECPETVACTTKQYDVDPSSGGNSATYEFQLYCNKRYLEGFCGSCFFLGMIVFLVVAKI